MKYQIDSHIPIPPEDKPYRGFNGRPTKYPFAEMEKGDSVLFEGEGNGGKAHSSALVSARLYGVEFRSALEGSGIRIWRMS